MGAAQQDPLTMDDTCEGKLLLFGALGSGERAAAHRGWVKWHDLLTDISMCSWEHRD